MGVKSTAPLSPSILSHHLVKFHTKTLPRHGASASVTKTRGSVPSIQVCCSSVSSSPGSSPSAYVFQTPSGSLGGCRCTTSLLLVGSGRLPQPSTAQCEAVPGGAK